jgi:hypothetical protein
MARVTKNKGGRPRKAAGERKRNTLRFRATDDLTRRLTADAILRGLSLSEEIERRIEGSLASEGRIVETLAFTFGKRVAGLLLVFLYTLREAEISTLMFTRAESRGADAKSWLDDPWAFDQMTRAVARVLDAARPAGDPAPPEWVMKSIERVFGAKMAANAKPELLGDVVAKAILLTMLKLHPGESPHPGEEWAADALKLLGPLADRIRQKIVQGGRDAPSKSEDQNDPPQG